MIQLSKRLSAVESMVPSGACVCDVGTDHGYLPAALYLSGRAVSVIATDIREKPLATARDNLKRLGAGGVELCLCDGLSGVDVSRIDTVIISGIGGEVIAGILQRCSAVADRRILLILQPTTSAEVLRKFLAENGFAVCAEPTVKENGKVYSTMAARYDGIVRTLDPAAYYIGMIRPLTESDRCYIEKQYRRCSTCAQELAHISQQGRRYLHYKAAADRLHDLLEVNINAV